jgi:hypothetical protein
MDNKQFLINYGFSEFAIKKQGEQKCPPLFLMLILSF